MSKQLLVTVAREPVRTRIDHRPDGTLVIRQYSQDVVRDENGVEVGRSSGLTAVELEHAEITADTRTQIAVITAQAEAKVPVRALPVDATVEGPA